MSEEKLTLVGEKALQFLLKELTLLKGLEEAVRKDELRQPWFVIEELLKIDKARENCAD